MTVRCLMLVHGARTEDVFIAEELDLILGFTGTQNGMTDRQKAEFCLFVRSWYYIEQFHHGMCIGSDEQAEELIRIYHPSITVYGHPPRIKSKMSRTSKPDTMYPEADYLVRNRRIVRYSTYLIATPGTSNEILRSGTWSTIRYARRKEIPIKLILP